MRLALVLCLAALCGSAAAGRPDLFDVSGDAGRGLLQSGADCSSIPNCATCRFQFVRGTVTRAVCTACNTGYVPKALGTACYCTSGYYWDVGTSRCLECGYNQWCAGAKSTPTSASRTGCGNNKNTTTTLAKSDRECLTNAGYGWASGDATQCNPGYYNPGSNNRRCSRCPGGLTTASALSTDPTACVAPPGSYYLRGKAVLCAQGTWKNTTANEDCQECPAGITTAATESGKTAPADCAFVKAGFYVTAAAWGGGAAYVGGTTAATECPADTYRSGDATAVASASGDNACTACPYGLKTQEGVTGATSVDECLAPPGWGFNGTAANECGSGKYKEGWNKEACSDCGTGFETDATNSTSEGDCKVPPGFGASSADGGVTWTAVKCPVNTYGRSDPTYGRVLVECTKCMDNTWTQGLDTRTSASACVTVAGYGYDDGAVTQCDAGTYNVGNNTSPCTSCGVGKDTTADGLTSLAGATDPAQCLMAKGWESDGATGLKKCKQGYYKATISNTACTQCPNGTTTSVAGATALSGCDACRAGFGASSISASAPSCGICGSGKYSAPITSGGAACLSCPVPGGYNGAMVSRQGIAAPEQCLQEFPTSDTSTSNSLEWDILTVPDAAFTANGNTTINTCQGACKTNPACVYFEFNSTAPGTCRLLEASDVTRPATNALTTAGPTDYWLLLEVKEGQYATYKMAQTKVAVGDAYGATTTDFADAKAACDGASKCAGIYWNGAAWHTFSGKTWWNVIGKVRVVGETVNPWVADPSSAPN
jgi:hypothetical protein